LRCQAGGPHVGDESMSAESRDDRVGCRVSDPLLE
jgi:hypothetical protein